MTSSGTAVRAVALLIGFTAAIGQIVLMRELMVAFCGNEVSLGLMLASWLAWTALGSGIAGRFTARLQHPQFTISALQAAVALALPCAIVGVRVAKAALQTVPGESLGPGAMLAVSLTALSAFCAASGALFAVACRLFARQSAKTADAAGSVYLLEALGSALGGALAGLVLAPNLTAMQIAWGLAFLNLAMAAALGIRPRRARFAALGVLAGASVLGALPGGLPSLDAASLARFWRGSHLVAARNSAYGNLAVVEAGGSRSLYENGLVLFSVPDPEAAEEAVHYALLEHPAPRRLLLIGGGFNGSIAQALRHPSLERVDLVELDPAVLTLARQYFPQQWAPLQADPRVRLHVTDGRLFLKTTASTFDVIAVNLPDPQTAQLNRFYTLEFFRDAAAKLAPGGVLALQLTGSENYVSPELAEFLRSIHRTLRAAFPEVTAIPGGTVHFFASRERGVLARDAGELLGRLRARRLTLDYVSEYYLPFRMTPDRVADFESQIRPRADTPLNRDFTPIAYYFNVALWSSRFHPGYRRVFQALAAVDFRTVAAAFGLALLVMAVIGRLTRAERRLKLAAACCTASMGFTSIGLEILLLLGFQAIYGSVYQQLALVIAAFMAGMAGGSWLARRRVAGDARALVVLPILAALAPLALGAVFQTAAPATGPVALAFVSRVLFPLLALLSGALGGYEFPVASRILEGHAGMLYALDLAGSCVGAVLLSAYFIPVFGLFRTATLIALVSLVPVGMAAWPASQAARQDERRRTPVR